MKTSILITSIYGANNVEVGGETIKQLSDVISVSLFSLPTIPRYHRKLDINIYCVSGEGELIVNKSRLIVKSGSFITLLAGTIYMFVPNSPMQILFHYNNPINIGEIGADFITVSQSCKEKKYSQSFEKELLLKEIRKRLNLTNDNDWDDYTRTNSLNIATLLELRRHMTSFK